MDRKASIFDSGLSYFVTFSLLFRRGFGDLYIGYTLGTLVMRSGVPGGEGRIGGVASSD